MEDDLKILKVEYLINGLLDHTQSSNLSLNDQIMFGMEDDPKILKVEYISNHSSDPPQILKLSSGDPTKIKNA